MDGARLEPAGGADRLDLIGGQLCLDFVNTVGAHDTDQPEEHLRNYADLVAWSRHAGALTADEARALLDAAARRPAEAATALTRAVALREALYRLFSRIAAGAEPAEDDLASVNAALAAMLARSRLVPAAGGFTWAWAGPADALDRPLWPVLHSTADLLTTGELQRVRECAGEGCGWLFVDLSRNRSRRWCDMRDCGNRAKARRHYQRRAGRESPRA